MKYSKIFIPVLLVVLFSCQTVEEKETPISAKHGGLLKINIPGFTWNFDPQTIEKQGDYHIAAQVYDGLLKYNPRNLTMTPAIAKYWVFGDEGRHGKWDDVCKALCKWCG